MKTVIFLCGAIALAQAQTTFDTPQAAAQALIDAVSTNNTAQLNAIFGPQGKTILSSGNPQQDQAEREEFSSIAKNKHRLQRDSMNSDRMILSIGTEDWPFPVPIVRSGGKWIFDTSLGQLSMEARRIGANELDAIEICAGYVGAQEAYAKEHGMHQYADRISSLASLVPAGFTEASGSSRKPYHGYYFSILTSQGPSAPGGASNYVTSNAMTAGFALVGWPAEYGVSGVHTFIVSREGIVYEKDLGPPASRTAPPVTSFEPDKTWTPVN